MNHAGESYGMNLGYARWPYNKHLTTAVSVVRMAFYLDYSVLDFQTSVLIFYTGERRQGVLVKGRVVTPVLGFTKDAAMPELMKGAAYRKFVNRGGLQQWKTWTKQRYSSLKHAWIR